MKLTPEDRLAIFRLKREKARMKAVRAKADAKAKQKGKKAL